MALLTSIPMIAGLVGASLVKQRADNRRRKKEREANVEQQRSDIERLESREDSAYQRAVVDAQKAGLHASSVVGRPSSSVAFQPPVPSEVESIGTLGSNIKDIDSLILPVIMYLLGKGVAR